MNEPSQPKLALTDGPRDSIANSPISPRHPDENAQTTVAHETPDSPSSAQFISRARASTTASINSATSSLRRGTMRLLDTDTPLGMWAATASATSQAPTLGDIRSGRVSRQGSPMGEEIHRHLERRGSSLGENGRRALSGTNGSLDIATPGSDGKRSRARTNSSLSMGTSRAGAKRQGSFGFGAGRKASGDDLATSPASFPSVKERDEEANHGIVEEVLGGEPSLQNANPKKSPLTEEEIAQVRTLFFPKVQTPVKDLYMLGSSQLATLSLQNFPGPFLRSLV